MNHGDSEFPSLGQSQITLFYGRRYDHALNRRINTAPVIGEYLHATLHEPCKTRRPKSAFRRTDKPVRTRNGMTQRDERLCKRTHPHSTYADQMNHFRLLVESFEKVLDPFRRLLCRVADGIYRALRSFVDYIHSTFCRITHRLDGLLRHSGRFPFRFLLL